MTIHAFMEKRYRSLLLLLVWIGLLYANAINNQFTLDDHSYIENNHYIRSIEGVGYLFFHPIEEGQSLRGHLYRPLSALVQYSIGKLFGYRPQAFHLVNVLLYVLNAFCLLLLLERLFGKTIAAIAVLVFACHPVHTEVVASAVGITELLAFQFVLLSLLFTLREGGARWFGAPAALFFLLALLSKETSVLLPAVGLLIAYSMRVDRRRYLLLGLVYAVPMVVYFALRKYVIGSFFRAPMVEFAFLDNPLCSLPTGERLISAVHVLLKYLLLLPAPVRLSADYSYNAIPFVASPWSFEFLFSAAVHAVLLALAWYLRRRCFVITFALAVFYVGLLPASNLLFCGGTIMGERFLYLPSVGMALVVAAGWQALSARSDRLQKTSFAALAILLVGFSAMTFVRNRAWANDYVLFKKVQDAYPGNAKAHYNAAVLEYRDGKAKESLRSVQRALEHYPLYIDARILWAELSARTGDLGQAERILRGAMDTHRGHEDVYLQLGGLYAETRRFNEAIEIYQLGVERIPRSMKIPYSLAMVYMEVEDYPQAERFLRLALGNEDFPDAHFALGHIGLARGDYASAQVEFHAARASAKLGGSAVKYEAFCHLMEGRYSLVEGLLGQVQGGDGDPDRTVLVAYARLGGGDRRGAWEAFRKLGLRHDQECARFTFPGLCFELAARLRRAPAVGE